MTHIPSSLFLVVATFLSSNQETLFNSIKLLLFSPAINKQNPYFFFSLFPLPPPINPTKVFTFFNPLLLFFLRISFYSVYIIIYTLVVTSGEENEEMRRGKGSQEEDVTEDEFGSRKPGPSSVHTLSVNANNNTSISNEADGKNSDKAKALRSKHSVTEQRRRSKINERFQILRDLIPNTDQKRDMASFLQEVIEYVQFLQEKVKKYEGSYQGWSSEPTKLMPWRNSHWRVQSFVGQPQAIKNDSGPGSTFPAKIDENNINISPTMITSAPNPVEADPIRDGTSKAMDQQPELANKGMPLPISGDNVFGHPIQRPVSQVQSTERLISNDTSNQQDNLTIEGGTISISSIYSQGLLNSLTQALQSTGLDLSQANISVQIDLGKRSNRGLTSGTSAKEPHISLVQATTRLRDMSSGDESDPVQKRLKK